MVTIDTILSLAFLKKSRFTGSDRGMRYCIRKIENDGISLLEVLVCPGPFSIDKTKEELFIKEEFPFTDEGRQEAVFWMNEMYMENFDFYEDVYEHPGHYYELHHI